MMRKLLFCILVTVAACVPASAQNFNREKNAWVNYVVRMYNNAPFEGVKVVDDATSQNLIVILSLDPQKYGGNEATMSRIAAVKAQSMAGRFFGGSTVTTDMVIRTTETQDDTTVELVETIKEKSSNLVKSLELLTTFTPDSDSSRKVYLFSTPVDQSR